MTFLVTCEGSKVQQSGEATSPESFGHQSARWELRAVFALHSALIFVEQMNFSVDEVVKNIKYFMTVVKRATGNIRDPVAEKSKSGPKPSKLHPNSIFSMTYCEFQLYRSRKWYSVRRRDRVYRFRTCS